MVAGGRAFIDLHCHTRASFDSLSSPDAVARVAASRGLTHLAITDHDRIDGALEARDAAPAGLTVLIGEEIRTADGDLIAVFLERAVPPGLSAVETVAAVREQGGLVGIPHPFDRFRGSLGRGSTDRARAAVGPVDRIAALASFDSVISLVDWIEVHNARLVGRGNERAAALARTAGVAGVAVSDAHSLVEVGVAYTAVTGDPSTPAGLLAALASAEIVPGRASYAVRAITPVAKVIQRLRGNRRVRPSAGQVR